MGQGGLLVGHPPREQRWEWEALPRSGHSVGGTEGSGAASGVGPGLAAHGSGRGGASRGRAGCHGPNGRGEGDAGHTERWRLSQDTCGHALIFMAMQKGKP